jgi:hypothetical protein
MEFPPTWRVFLDEEFQVAQPQIEGPTTMELMVQVRHTGRMLSNFRIGLGGEASLKVDVDLGVMVPREAFHIWRFRTQYWPRDIKIRTNMTTSVWIDLADTIALQIFTVQETFIPTSPLFFANISPSFASKYIFFLCIKMKVEYIL